MAFIEFNFRALGDVIRINTVDFDLVEFADADRYERIRELKFVSASTKRVGNWVFIVKLHRDHKDYKNNIVPIDLPDNPKRHNFIFFGPAKLSFLVRLPLFISRARPVPPPKEYVTLDSLFGDRVVTDDAVADSDD